MLADTARRRYTRPTRRLRWLVLLTELEARPDTTRRELTEVAGTTVTTAHQDLKTFEEEGWVRREATLSFSRDLLEAVCRRMVTDGLGRVALYSAGEVTEFLLHATDPVGLEVVAVLDDDLARQGTELQGNLVTAPEARREHDQVTPGPPSFAIRSEGTFPGELPCRVAYRTATSKMLPGL